ncbi:MAG: prolipoprotein diacylglyceryl transferase, partial [Myxococcales bacterium]|nr:prolipoprotein diacylglyceryl transferase [Myxococcales bacterium]
MSGPLIPYIKIPEIPLGLPKPFNSIKPFGVLVASAVYIGSIIAVRRATQRGLSADKMNSFILYVVGIGFIGAHVLDAIFYTPEKVLADPVYLLRFWDGLSSFGGFIGAITGVFVFKWRKGERDVMPYMDTVCSAFPLSWVIGRAGCATVHDHPGRETTSWMGVQFPEFHTDVMIKSKEFGLLYDPTLTVGRFDLGLTEMVLAIPLAVTFMILWQIKPRPFGFWAGWQCIAYAPVRFVLDFLRVESVGTHEGDPRYLGLTPAQYACFGFIAIGIIV